MEKKAILIGLGLGLVIGFSSCQKQAEKTPEKIDHVFLIGIDGLNTKGLAQANTPVIDSLKAQGSFVPQSRAVLPSVSAPNWASMLLGAGPEQHGVTNNGWRVEADSNLVPVVHNERKWFPSIFTVIRAQLPTAEIGSIYQWGDFGMLYDRAQLSYDRHFNTADSAVQAFAAYIQEKKPLFAAIHIDDVDHAGHTFGHETPEYIQAVQKADSLIGIIARAIKEAGIAENSVIMMASDHGGIRHGHGGITPIEMNTAVLLSGKGIKKGYTVKQPVYVYDVAATVAFALDLHTPYAWIGRPIKAAFTGFEEPQYAELGTDHLEENVQH